MADSFAPLYEGLFLMNPQALAGDRTSGVDRIQAILDRAGAEVLTLRKWDERKLAYPTKDQKRSTYPLSLFRVDGSKITRIERDCLLSEDVLRVLITRGDHLAEAEIEAAINATDVARDEAKLRAIGEGDE